MYTMFLIYIVDILFSSIASISDHLLMLLLGYQYRSTHANPIIPSVAVEGELEQKLIIHLSDQTHIHHHRHQIYSLRHSYVDIYWLACKTEEQTSGK
jgi:hypothetical protein